jgi:RNase H-fold protein (predicted Holliday junction resolvase)
MSKGKPQKTEEELVLPQDYIYEQIKKAIANLEKEFKEYKVSNIIVGVSVTASLPPSITGSVSATLTKK